MAERTAKEQQKNSKLERTGNERLTNKQTANKLLTQQKKGERTANA
jgi:hypothetical protein